MSNDKTTSISVMVRDIENTEEGQKLINDPVKLCLFQLFIRMAQYQTKEVTYLGKKVKLNRGQLLINQQKLVKKYPFLTRQKLRSTLDYMENEGLISVHKLIKISSNNHKIQKSQPQNTVANGLPTTTVKANHISNDFVVVKESKIHYGRSMGTRITICNYNILSPLKDSGKNENIVVASFPKKQEKIDGQPLEQPQIHGENPETTTPNLPNNNHNEIEATPKLTLKNNEPSNLSETLEALQDIASTLSEGDGETPVSKVEEPIKQPDPITLLKNNELKETDSKDSPLNPPRGETYPQAEQNLTSDEFQLEPDQKITDTQAGEDLTHSVKSQAPESKDSARLAERDSADSQAKPKKSKVKRFATLADVKPEFDHIDKNTIELFIEHRMALGISLSAGALNLNLAVANRQWKHGISPEEALGKAIRLGWRGLQDKYFEQPNSAGPQRCRPQPKTFDQIREEENQKVLERYLNNESGNSKQEYFQGEIYEHDNQ